MLALHMWRATRCPHCGRALRECTAPDAEYKAALPTRCHATTALLQAQKPYADTPQAEALLFHIERR
jgi:hypothetical protein